MNDQHFMQLLKIVPNVSRETFHDLYIYETLVRKWQPHINLIANATLPDLWQRHILDCAQLFPLQPEAENWLDLGSGGGFPGIVIAIFLKAQGKGHISLVESNGKKTAFLRTVIATLSLPATVYNMRIEYNYSDILFPDVVTARALTSLSGLLNFIVPLMSHKTVALMQKGRDYMHELDEVSAKWQFNLIKHISVVNEDSVILEIRNLRNRTVGKNERQEK